MWKFCSKKNSSCGGWSSEYRIWGWNFIFGNWQTLLGEEGSVWSKTKCDFTGLSWAIGPHQKPLTSEAAKKNSSRISEFYLATPQPHPLIRRARPEKVWTTFIAFPRLGSVGGFSPIDFRRASKFDFLRLFPYFASFLLVFFFFGEGGGGGGDPFSFFPGGVRFVC